MVTPSGAKLKALPFLIGASLCLSYVAMPWGYTWWKTPPGQVWVPVHDQLHLCSDDKFYAAGMRESRAHPFQFRSPVASKPGTYWVEIFKEGSRLLAAALTLGISEPRVAYVVSFVLGLLLSYSALFAFARAAGLDSWLALLLSVVTLFWLKLFIPGFGWASIVEDLWNRSGASYFDLVSDHLRYVILHTAVIFAWAALWFGARTEKLWEGKGWIAFLALAVALPYSYLAITLSAGAIIGLQLLLTAGRDRRQWISLGLALLVLLVILTLVGFWGHARHFLQSGSEVVIQSHLAPQFRPMRERILLSLGHAAYYVLPILLPWVWLRNRGGASPAVLRLILSTAIVMGIFSLALLSLRAGDFVRRLLVRGVSSLWLAVALAAVFLVWQRFSGRAIRGVLVVALFIAGAVPLVGSFRMMEPHFRAFSHYLPAAEWEAFKFVLEKTPPESRFYAPDLTANQLLPVYTDAGIHGAAPNYSSENSEESLEKFIIGWKLMDGDPNVVRTWLNDYVAGVDQFRCSPGNDMENRAKSEPSQVIQNLLYDPYVKRIFNSPVRAPDGKALSLELKARAERLLNARLDRPASAEAVDYIILSEPIEKLRIVPFTSIPGYKLVFRNDLRTLYQRCDGPCG